MYVHPVNPITLLKGQFMKMLLIAVSMIVSLSALASDTTFRSDTKLPLELQKLIDQSIAKQCSSSSYANETSTLEETKHVDQGIVDTFYTSTFLTTWYFDGQHPVGTYITVKSVEWAVSNPLVEKYQVLEVSADSDVCQIPAKESRCKYPNMQLVCATNASGKMENMQPEPFDPATCAASAVLYTTDGKSISLSCYMQR